MTFDELRALDAGIGERALSSPIHVCRASMRCSISGAGEDRDLRGCEAGHRARSAWRLIRDHGMLWSTWSSTLGGSRKIIQQIDPKLKIMPESMNVDMVKRIISELHAPVIAFGASDWKPEIIKLAKDSGAELYVDRMGLTDAPAGWQSAIDDGADGIQTDPPRGASCSTCGTRGYKKP